MRTVPLLAPLLALFASLYAFAAPATLATTAVTGVVSTGLLATGGTAQAATPPGNQSESGSESGYQCERRKETPTS